MQSNAVVNSLPSKDAQAEAAVLLGVLADSWAERRRQPIGSEDRAFVPMLIHGLVEYLRRLG